jgi:hypothetical protein
MIPMSAMIFGGHLLIAVADRIPQVNFERTCREATSGELAASDRFSVCMDDERAARDELAKGWNGFDAEDRTRCARMSTTGQSASYIELLTCLDMAQIAGKIHADARASGGTGSVALAAVPREPPAPESEMPAREREKPPAPVRHAQLVRHHAPAPPVSLAPPEPPQPLSGFLQVICLPGLRDVLAACH